MAQTLTQIKRILAERGIHPKHRLGQNFLHDGNQMRRIVHAAAIAEGDVVLEVGMGTGSLSEQLLEAGAWVVGVEVDRDLEPILVERLEPFAERLTLVAGDVLSGKHAINPRVIDALRSVGGRVGATGFKLIANLPYSIVSPLIANLAVEPLDIPLLHAVVMVQEEVADRLQAQPGGKDYGALSVVVQARFEVRSLFRVAPDCFWPRPKVHSTVVEICPRAEPVVADVGALARTAQHLFSKRRKQLGTILGRDRVLPGGIDPGARPENLSVEQFAALSGWFDG